MHPAYGHVDGMLHDAFVALYADKVTLDIVVYFDVVEPAVVLAIELAELFKFLVKCLPYERSHIEIECRDGLTAVHFILHGFHRDTTEDAGGLDSFCRA